MTRSLNHVIARFLGLEAVSEELVAACNHRIRTRCAQVDLSIYRKKPAERRLQTEACEAICGAFRDHFPDRAETFKISNTWPGAKVMIKGTRTGFTAWIEPWIGLDYADPDDGMETIELDIDLRADHRSVMEKVNDVLFHRDPRATKKVERPELPLTQKAAPRKELAPVGKPEEALRQASRVANGTAAPSPSGKRAEQQKPQPSQASKPRPESSRKTSR